METTIEKKSTSRLRSRQTKADQEIVETLSVEKSGQNEIETVPLARFTLETLLYGIIFLLGLTLRLWKLDAYPLSDTEALQGVAAYTLYQGNAIEAGAYSPLLVSLITPIFFLLNDSASAARLVTALAGSVLVLFPVILRRQLGQKTSLLAAVLLAISPIAIFLSRTLNGEIAVAAGALLVVTGFFNWVEKGRQSWLYLMMTGLAVLLTAGAMAYTMLMVFGVIVAIRWDAFKGLWTQGLERAEADPDSSNVPAPNDDDTETQTGLHSSLRRAGIFFVILLVLLATTASFNLSGLGVTTSLFTVWLSQFGFQSQPDAGFNAVFLLTIYEPLLVIAGFAGMAYAVLSKDLLRQLFVGWFIGALLLDLIMAERSAGAIILTVVPLAFLAAMAIAHLWKELQRRGSWGNEGVILAAGLVIATFGYIGLTGWLVRPCAEDDTFCQLAWIQPLAAFVMFIVIIIFFWFISGPGPAVRGAALTGTVLGLMIAVNIGGRLNYGPLMNLVYQPVAGVPASTELVSLSETLSSQSLLRTGDNKMLDIGFVGQLGPAMQWQLRNYQNVSQYSSVLKAPTTAAIITPILEDAQFNLGEAYLGQDFSVNAAWSPVGLAPKDLINWLIYRENLSPLQNEKVILWLHVD